MLAYPSDKKTNSALTVPPIIPKIQAFNDGRDPERLQLKYSKMRSNAFVFMRGSCHLFYQNLHAGHTLNTAPLTWVSGDLHLENFGSYKGDNRQVYFDVNDFDESILAPASWDLLRMLTSVWVGAKSLSIKHEEARQLCLVFLDAYCDALAHGKAYWVERDTSQGQIGSLLQGLRDRARGDYLDSRTQTKGKKRRLRIDGKKALEVSTQQRTSVEDFMSRFAATQANPDFYEVLDVARRIAGTGSLGVDRYVILVQGKGGSDGNYLLDLKQSLPSSLTPYLTVEQPKWETQAHRCVAIQRRFQAVSMAFLYPVLFDKQAYVLRGLQASEDRISLDHASESMSDLKQSLETMGKIVAWSQLRSSGRQGSAIADELIRFGQDTAWQAPLLSASEDSAQQVDKDSALFNSAYDDGVFGVSR
jgi:uncharacterized protein (DUF2252 family)